MQTQNLYSTCSKVHWHIVSWMHFYYAILYYIIYISYNIAFGPAEYRAVFSTTNVFFKLYLYVFKYAFRSSFGSTRSEVFFKMGILRNFPKFTGKHLCKDSFLIKLQALGSDTSLFL